MTGVTGRDSGDRASVAITAIARAERDRGGDSRVYRLHVAATDQAGRSCQTTLTVAVPRHPGRAVLDSAEPSYDSLTGSNVTGH